MFIAGNGPERERLENLIQEMNLSGIIKMLGYVTNLEEYQKIADISISCSKREGLPLNIVEAMLSGTPVVASINRGHKELIANGENGFLVEQNDFRGMSQRIVELLKNTVLYDRIKIASEKKAQLYSFSNVKKELLKVYGFKNEQKN